MIGKKCIWLMTKIIIGILVIGHAFFIFIDYVMLDKAYVQGAVILRSVVNSAAGVPYYQGSGFVNDSPELRPITTENWYNVQCDHRPRFPYLEFIIPGDELRKMSPAKRTQLECLAIESVSSYSSSDGISEELCSGYFNCRTLVLEVEDYVLAKPDILWNILKIIERPCDYVNPLENFKKKSNHKEIVDFLGCDGKKKYWWRAKEDYVILNIYRSGDKRPRDFFSIAVKRKDI